MVAVGIYIQQILLLLTIKVVLAQWPGSPLGEPMFEPSTAAMLAGGMGLDGLGGSLGMGGAGGGGLGAPGLRGPGRIANQIPILPWDTVAEYNEVPPNRKPFPILLAEQQWRAYGWRQRNLGFGFDPNTTVTERPRRYKYPDQPNGQPVPTGPDKNAWKKMRSTFDRTLKAFPNGLKPINRKYINEATEQYNGVQPQRPANNRRTNAMHHSRPFYQRYGSNGLRLPASATSLVPRFRSSHARLHTTITPTLHTHFASNRAHQRTHQQASTFSHASHTMITKTGVVQKDLSKGSPLSPSVLPPGGSSPVRLANSHQSSIANTNNQLHQTSLRQTDASYPSGNPSTSHIGTQRSSANVHADTSSLQGISQANTKPMSQVSELGHASTQPGVYDLRGVKAPSVGYTPLISSGIGNFPKKQPNIESMRQAVQNGENLSVSSTRNMSSQSTVNVSASPNSNKSSTLDALTQAAEGPSLPHLNPLDKTRSGHFRSGIPHNIESVTSVPQLSVYGQTQAFGVYEQTQGPVMGNYGTQTWGYGQTTNTYDALYQTTPIMTQSPYDQYPYTTNSLMNAGSQYDQYPYNGNSQTRQSPAYQKMAALHRQQRYYEQQQVLQQQQRIQMDRIRQQQLLTRNRPFQNQNTPTSQIQSSVNTLKKSEKVPRQVEMNTTVEPLTTQPQPQPFLTTSAPPTTLSTVTTESTGKPLESTSVSLLNQTTLSIINETSTLSNTKGVLPNAERPNLWGGNPPPPPLEQDRVGIRPDNVKPNPDPYARIIQDPMPFNSSVKVGEYSSLVNQITLSETTVTSSDVTSSQRTNPLVVTSAISIQVDKETSTAARTSVSPSNSTESISTSTQQTQTNAATDPVTETKPDILLTTERMLTSKGMFASSMPPSPESETTVSPIISTGGLVSESKTTTSKGLLPGVTKVEVNENQISAKTVQNMTAQLPQENDPSQRWIPKSGVDHHLTRMNPIVSGQSLVLAQKGFDSTSSGRLSPRDHTELNRDKVSITEERNRGILKLHQQPIHSESASAFNSFGHSRHVNPSHRTFHQNRLSSVSQSTLVHPHSPLHQHETSLSGQNVRSSFHPHFTRRPLPHNNAAIPLTTQPRLLPRLSHQRRNTRPASERIPYRYPGIANSHTPTGVSLKSSVDVNSNHVSNNVHQRPLPTAASRIPQRAFDHHTAPGLTGHHAAQRPTGHTADHGHGNHPSARGHPARPGFVTHPTGQANPVAQGRPGHTVPARGIGRQIGVTRRFAGSPTAQGIAGRPVNHGRSGHHASHRAPGHPPVLQGLAAQGHSKHSAKLTNRPIVDSSVLRIMQKGLSHSGGALNKKLTYNIRDQSNTEASVNSSNSVSQKQSGHLAIALSKGFVSSSTNQSISNVHHKQSQPKDRRKETGAPGTNVTKLAKSTEMESAKNVLVPTLQIDSRKTESPTNKKRQQTSSKLPLGNLIVVQRLANNPTSQALSDIDNRRHGILTVNVPTRKTVDSVLNTKHTQPITTLAKQRAPHILHKNTFLPHTTTRITPRHSVNRLSSNVQRLSPRTLKADQFVRTATSTARKVASVAQLVTNRPRPTATRLADLRSTRVSPMRSLSLPVQQPHTAPRVLPVSPRVTSASQRIVTQPRSQQSRILQQTGQNSPSVFSRAARVSPLQSVSVSPLQQAPVSPNRRAPVSPLQRAPVRPFQRAPVATLRRTTRPTPRLTKPVQISTPNIHISTHRSRQVDNTNRHGSHVHAGIGARSRLTARHL